MIHDPATSRSFGRSGPRITTLTWPVLGALSCLLIAYGWGRWLVQGPSGVSPGSDQMPAMQLILMHALEWIQFAAFLVIVWKVVVQPLVRREPLGFDGLFVIAAVLLNFWDVMDNYWTFSFQYNAYQLNLASWGAFIPGWRSPRPELWSVPLAFVFGAYTWAFFLAARMGCFLLTWLGEKRPTWSLARRFGIVFLVNCLIEVVSENTYLRIGAIANIRPFEPLTLWDGTQYAWPLYNPILFALTWTAMVALRWSCDGDGLSFVERAVPRVTSPGRSRTVMRFLAIFAFMQVSYLVLYFLPWNIFAAMRQGPPNVFPSYFPVP